MIKAKFRISKPDEVPCQLGIQMTLGEFKYVRSALVNGKYNGPAQQVVAAIDELITAAEQEFEPEHMISPKPDAELKSAA